MANSPDMEINFKDIRLPNFGGMGVWWIAIIVALIWAGSGIYIVQPDEAGVVLRFGKMSRITSSGLNYHLPYPFETVETPQVTEVKRVEIGFRTVNPGPPARYESIPQESLMLTGDENIVDIDMIVQFKIKDPAKYLFQVRDVYRTIRKVSESTLRQVVGQHKIDKVLTDGKFEVQNQILESIQETMNSYEAGVVIVAVQLQDVHPPEQVLDAFKDVASALEDKNRFINQAQGYQNDIIPKTRGRGEEIIRQSESFNRERILRAEGDVNRFLAVLEEYRKSPDVTKRRMYIETMEKILPGLKKYIAKLDGNNNFMPLLDMRTGK